jgi:phospholipase/lecithinase/hemolysin
MPTFCVRLSHLRPTVKLYAAFVALMRASALLILLAVGGSTALASAQEFTKIVVFGDSLSDVGNVAHLTQSSYGFRIPGVIANYADGRFTDGIYTSPAAQRFNGVWVEQLAAMLPSHPVVKDSLDGGTDYAYGYATTGTGTGVLTFGATNAFPVNVENIGAQISQYLASNPRIHEKTLFIVWGGAIDLLHAQSLADVVNGPANEASEIQRLIDAGARNFIIPNLPPLGLIPLLNGSPYSSIPATQASAFFNQMLAARIAALRLVNTHKHVHLYELDVFGLYNQVASAPSLYGLTNVTASSQGEPVTPDTYLFWDGLHPTTSGHNILAMTALHLLDPDQCGARSDHGCDRDEDHVKQVEH